MVRRHLEKLKSDTGAHTCFQLYICSSCRETKNDKVMIYMKLEPAARYSQPMRAVEERLYKSQHLFSRSVMISSQIIVWWIRWCHFHERKEIQARATAKYQSWQTGRQYEHKICWQLMPGSLNVGFNSLSWENLDVMRHELVEGEYGKYGYCCGNCYWF